MYCEASSCGVGVVLAHEAIPFAYASWILNLAEQNYSITETGCNAVMYASNIFHCYFNEIPVNAITDHKF